MLEVARNRDLAHSAELRIRMCDNGSRQLARPLWSSKIKSSLSGLVHQAILMMQAAKDRCLHNTETGGQLVSVVVGRNTVLIWFRNSRT
jgi:hypothetical protein